MKKLFLELKKMRKNILTNEIKEKLKQLSPEEISDLILSAISANNNEQIKKNIKTKKQKTPKTPTEILDLDQKSNQEFISLEPQIVEKNNTQKSIQVSKRKSIIKESSKLSNEVLSQINVNVSTFNFSNYFIGEDLKLETHLKKALNIIKSEPFKFGNLSKISNFMSFYLVNFNNPRHPAITDGNNIFINSTIFNQMYLDEKDLNNFSLTVPYLLATIAFSAKSMGAQPIIGLGKIPSMYNFPSILNIDNDYCVFKYFQTLECCKYLIEESNLNISDLNLDSLSDLFYCRKAIITTAYWSIITTSNKKDLSLSWAGLPPALDPFGLFSIINKIISNILDFESIELLDLKVNNDCVVRNIVWEFIKIILKQKNAVININDFILLLKKYETTNVSFLHKTISLLNLQNLDDISLICKYLSDEFVDEKIQLLIVKQIAESN